MKEVVEQLEIGKEVPISLQRKIQLEGLLFIKRLCEENNLKFFLTGGSLLGAVKYQGYIPWDDDIDIGMLREDYMKLMDLLIKNENDDYKVLSIYNCKDYYYPFAKLVSKKTRLFEDGKAILEMGVYIDIFPVDDVPEDYQNYYNSLRFIRNLATRRMRIKKKKYNNKVKFQVLKDWGYGFIDWVSLPLGYNFWVKKLDKKLRSYQADGSGLVAPAYGRISFPEKKEVFLQMAEVTFEGYKFNASSNYEEYLTRVYGNYLEDIAEERKKRPHKAKVVWR